MGARRFTLIRTYTLPVKGAILEVGSDRGEGSTKYLSDFALESDRILVTVDFEEKAFSAAFQIVKQHKLQVALQMKGEEFVETELPRSELTFAFVYLDGFDYTYKDIEGQQWVNVIAMEYKRYGMEMNNKNSEESHRFIAEKLHPYCEPGCIMVIDDTFLVSKTTSFDKSQYGGKGATTVPFLRKLGWTVLAHNTNRSDHPSLGFVVLQKKKDK